MGYVSTLETKPKCVHEEKMKDVSKPFELVFLLDYLHRAVSLDERIFFLESRHYNYSLFLPPFFRYSLCSTEPHVQ